MKLLIAGCVLFALLWRARSVRPAGSVRRGEARAPPARTTVVIRNGGRRSCSPDRWVRLRSRRTDEEQPVQHAEPDVEMDTQIEAEQATEEEQPVQHAEPDVQTDTQIEEPQVEEPERSSCTPQ